VAVLLGLGHGVLGNAGLAQDLGQGVGDDRGLHQIVLGDLQVSVILEHTGKLHAGVVATVELVEILPVKGQGNLLGPVAAEVEKDHAVAVGNLGHGCTAALHHESGQVLVDAAGLVPVGLNGLPGGGEQTALALHMGPPAGFHHGPVGLVAVHGNDHTAAAGGDGVVAALGVQAFQDFFQLVHIVQSGGGGHVTAVQQDVAVDLLHALGVGLLQHGDEMGNVGMDVAVGQQTQEMQGVAVLGVGDQVLPGVGRVESAAGNGLADQLGTLRVDLAAAQGVVAHFAVAHVLIGGQTDGGAVGFQIGVGAGGPKMIQRGGGSQLHGIAGAAVTFAYAIHNDQYDRFFHIRFLQTAASRRPSLYQWL